MKSRREEGLTQMSSNKFEVLKSKVMNIREESGKEIEKDRKTILNEERLKKEKPVEVWKTWVENSGNNVEKKKKLLRKITVKIGLK